VIPAASALRTASAVGAETDTITDAPIAELFCTISTETRLVRRLRADSITHCSVQGYAARRIANGFPEHPTYAYRTPFN
jgi:hypothetical protein